MLESWHKGDSLDLAVDAGRGLVYADWHGVQTAATVVAGCERLFACVVTTGASRLLNDNTRVVGGWDGAVQEVARDWIPRLISAGVRHVAWVQSPDPDSRSSASRAASDAGKDSVVRLFYDRAAAEAWLALR